MATDAPFYGHSRTWACNPRFLLILSVKSWVAGTRPAMTMGAMGRWGDGTMGRWDDGAMGALRVPLAEGWY